MSAENSITLSPQYFEISIDRSDKQPSTKLKYKAAIRKMLSAGVDPLDYDSLADYAGLLKQSGRGFLKAALHLISSDAELAMKAGATTDNMRDVQIKIWMLEAMNKAVKIEKHQGTKNHTWLSQSQVKDLTKSCSNKLKGRRDWIVLGLLLGAGLRRDELATLTFKALQTLPMKGDKMRDVIVIKHGKGDKSRVIPIKKILADRLREWESVVDGGDVARSILKGGKIGKSLSTVGIFDIVRSHGRMIGVENLAPHDLRRTFAQLGYEAGVGLVQIQILLGHNSIDTTQKYLNLSLDLETTASDFIPLTAL